MLLLKKLSSEEAAKVKRGLCKHHGCRKKRERRCHECASHKKRRFALKHPVRYAYMVWRVNAKRRGKDFRVTFEQFCAFNDKTEYVEKKGIGADDLTIDRKINSKGYTPTNIQALTMSENSHKFTNDWVPLPDPEDGRPPF